jgi:NIMA (never in mitosis gene a)-related kinase
LNILHRDFKSANIFLFEDGAAKIGDLNVSKILNKSLGQTQTGTPYYASPEVWNNSPYDCKSDIWSLGCILYEMLTLNPPFNADDFEGLYKKVMAGKYNKINSRYSEDMNELLKLLFKIDPKERPNCDEILKLDFIRKRIDFFKAEAGLDFNSIDTMDDNELLKTIRLSKNLVGLKDKLPKPNYTLPKINMNNLTKTKFNNDLQKEVLTTTNNTNTNLTKNMDTFNNKTKPNNDMITLKKIRINSEQRYLNEKNEKNKYKDLYNLYTVSRSKNNNIYKIKKNEEKKNVGINNRKSNNNDKKIFDTYKLYLSKEMRKFLSKNKKYRLPNINVNKNSQNLLLNKK